MTDSGKTTKRIRSAETASMSPALSRDACGQPSAVTVDRRIAWLFDDRSVPSR